MQLLIDADRNPKTGWHGYDFVVNSRVVSATQTTLKRLSDGKTCGLLPTAWTAIRLAVTVPRALLGLTGTKTTTLDFHWLDNCPHRVGASWPTGGMWAKVPRMAASIIVTSINADKLMKPNPTTLAALLLAGLTLAAPLTAAPRQPLAKVTVVPATRDLSHFRRDDAAPGGVTRIYLNAARVAAKPLSPDVFGNFIENLGDVIYDTLWANALHNPQLERTGPNQSEAPVVGPDRRSNLAGSGPAAAICRGGASGFQGRMARSASASSCPPTGRAGIR